MSHGNYGAHRCKVTLLIEDVTQGVASQVFQDGEDLAWVGADGRTYELTIEDAETPRVV